MPTATILAVEDNEEHAALLEAVFAAGTLDVDVRVVGIGAAAMAYLESERPLEDPPPNLIVLDLWLPDTTGLDLLEWIVNDERFVDIPVIMLSSSNDPRHAERAFALGARRYVFKPTGFHKLASTVGEVLNQWLLKGGETKAARA